MYRKEYSFHVLCQYIKGEAKIIIQRNQAEFTRHVRDDQYLTGQIQNDSIMLVIDGLLINW